MTIRWDKNRADIRYAREHGWLFDGTTRRGHLRFIHPKTPKALVLHSKQGHWRGDQNAITWIKRLTPSPVEKRRCAA
ncbi:hypothetical protein ACIBCN_18960 [Nocardia sp. NPDC051052]|uniref:hypothetical protein n=1 Tax=Nocardia sp. NPDC051052 TaxID=3364322 RepID=UPI0037A7ED36